MQETKFLPFMDSPYWIQKKTVAQGVGSEKKENVLPRVICTTCPKIQLK